MGRPPLSQEATKETTMHLIQVARTLMLQDGLRTVTIRKIAQEADLNSAILYRYFKDLDELLLFACVDLLKSYSDELLQSEGRMELSSPEKTYLISWELFCKHSFQYPECVNHLFFSKHSNRLDHVIRSYYELFPEQLAGMSHLLQVMIRTSNLYQRNLEVLRPLLNQRVSEERLQLINDLTVAYFQMLLNEKIKDGQQVDDHRQTGRMLEACKLLLTLG